jgi:hypothetical protein
MAYQSIVFLQGDDASAPIDALYNRESPGSRDWPVGVVYHGPSEESIVAAFEYLKQWDYGEPTETLEAPGSGQSDDVWEQAGYRLSAHLGLGYMGLERIVEEEV